MIANTFCEARVNARIEATTSVRSAVARACFEQLEAQCWAGEGPWISEHAPQHPRPLQWQGRYPPAPPVQAEHLAQRQEVLPEPAKDQPCLLPTEAAALYSSMIVSQHRMSPQMKSPAVVQAAMPCCTRCR